MSMTMDKRMDIQFSMWWLWPFKLYFDVFIRKKTYQKLHVIHFIICLYLFSTSLTLLPRYSSQSSFLLIKLNLFFSLFFGFFGIESLVDGLNWIHNIIFLWLRKKLVCFFINVYSTYSGLIGRPNIIKESRI